MARTGIALGYQPRYLTRRDPFRELSELQHGFNRAFSEAFGLTGDGAAAVGAWTPTVDIFEDENRFVIKLELPEVNREDVKVAVDKNLLTVSGERRLENEEKRDSYHRIERSYGQFFRSFSLSPNANLEAIGAEFKDGVLKLSVPKKEEAKPRQIQIEVK
ncbi:MAG TPA: Hsp20/alpha crystallin family protein [Blastocatellia bacterium]|nr:Hsp20/alpha crystallin family protein [Blastocatellia bacterium]